MYLERKAKSSKTPSPLLISRHRRAANAGSARLRLPAVVQTDLNVALFHSWTLLEMGEDERRRLVLAAEIYTETQPAFFGLTGQYALQRAEIEALDKTVCLRRKRFDAAARRSQFCSSLPSSVISESTHAEVIVAPVING
jgi:hypothetical protein